MKSKNVTSLLLTGALLVSAPASAATDTTFLVIGRLVASSSSGDGYRVYPATGYSLPADLCSKSDFAEMQDVGPSSIEKDAMARTLATAFWSNRKVQLRLDGCGLNDRPAYRIVRMDKSQ